MPLVMTLGFTLASGGAVKVEPRTVTKRLKLLGPAQPYPPPAAVALRTQRFQQALETLKPPSGQQASR